MEKNDDTVTKNKRITRGAAIRMKCLDCCNYQKSEVRLCPAKTCPLWNFRLGREIKEES